MKPLILHIGIPKTGTTSIQSTLFWNTLQEPFRLLSLDTFFGNRAMSAVFKDRSQSAANFFTDTQSKKQQEYYRTFSKRYLHESLDRCARAGLTPIISAECIWRFQEREHQNIRLMANQYGFTPVVHCYLRPPVDRMESSIQQNIKTGVHFRIEDVLSKTLAYRRNIQDLDRVYASENVNLHIFDPNTFPERCVVRHFFAAIGLSSQQISIHRENDSANLNVLQFMSAWNLFYQENNLKNRTRFQRRLVLESLKDLDGPKLHISPALVANLLTGFEEQQDFFKQRIGRTIPLSLSTRGDSVGIERMEDLLEFTKESLDWLWGSSAARPAGNMRSSRSLSEVVDRLNQLKWTYVVSQTRKHLWSEWKLRGRRNRLIQRNLA